MNRPPLHRYLPTHPDYPDRADLMLAGIPSLFITTYLFGTHIFTSHPIITGLAALVTIALVFDCLFFHPPDNPA